MKTKTKLNLKLKNQRNKTNKISKVENKKTLNRNNRTIKKNTKLKTLKGTQYGGDKLQEFRRKFISEIIKYLGPTRFYKGEDSTKVLQPQPQLLKLQYQFISSLILRLKPEFDVKVQSRIDSILNGTYKLNDKYIFKKLPTPDNGRSSSIENLKNPKENKKFIGNIISSIFDAPQHNQFFRKKKDNILSTISIILGNLIYYYDYKINVSEENASGSKALNLASANKITDINIETLQRVLEDLKLQSGNQSIDVETLFLMNIIDNLGISPYYIVKLKKIKLVKDENMGRNDESNFGVIGLYEKQLSVLKKLIKELLKEYKFKNTELGIEHEPRYEHFFKEYTSKKDTELYEKYIKDDQKETIKKISGFNQETISILYTLVREKFNFFNDSKLIDSFISKVVQNLKDNKISREQVKKIIINILYYYEKTPTSEVKVNPFNDFNFAWSEKPEVSAAQSLHVGNSDEGEGEEEYGFNKNNSSSPPPSPLPLPLPSVSNMPTVVHNFNNNNNSDQLAYQKRLKRLLRSITIHTKGNYNSEANNINTLKLELQKAASNINAKKTWYTKQNGDTIIQKSLPEIENLILSLKSEGINLPEKVK